MGGRPEVNGEVASDSETTVSHAIPVRLCPFAQIPYIAAQERLLFNSENKGF